jgi:hypothetical protein
MKRLVRQAYPDAEGSMFEQLALSSFLDALGDADMEWAVRQGQPSSVDAAVALAMQYEAFKNVRSRDLRGGDVMVVQPNQQTEAGAAGGGDQKQKNRKLGTCFYCDKPGHYKRDCKKLKRDKTAAAQANDDSGND